MIWKTVALGCSKINDLPFAHIRVRGRLNEGLLLFSSLELTAKGTKPSAGTAENLLPHRGRHLDRRDPLPGLARLPMVYLNRLIEPAERAAPLARRPAVRRGARSVRPLRRAEGPDAR
jgi:hypothetical protein